MLEFLSKRNRSIPTAVRHSFWRRFRRASESRIRQRYFPIRSIVLVSIGLMLLSALVHSYWLGLIGSVAAITVALSVVLVGLVRSFWRLMSPQQRTVAISLVGLVAALIWLLESTPLQQQFVAWYDRLNWDRVGVLGGLFGAVGQILIAILAVYVAWEQYVISKDLTIQQNTITQQQTIDSYFQGISELVLDEEGLLEDWPQERTIAEGRTAAILSSVDANGKAKILRFLSRSRLLTPIKRDRRLGRPILDGSGGYAEDREYGVKVIDLGVMLAGAELGGTDLRWTDLSDINLIRANLQGCDLVRTNLARTILVEANLSGSDLFSTRLFYGDSKTATPRTRADLPDYKTGEFTGAVIEDADFSEVQRLSEAQRYYCCAWGGAKTRSTIPGGCEGIPDRLSQQVQQTATTPPRRRSPAPANSPAAD